MSITILHRRNCAPAVHAFYHEGKAMFKGTPQHRKPLDMVSYLTGISKPNYPMPAIRQRDWVHIGYLSALNNFKVDDAFEFIKRYF